MLYGHMGHAVWFDRAAGRGVCLRDSGDARGAGLGFRDQGHCGTNVIGPGPRTSFPPPGREKGVLCARRP